MSSNAVAAGGLMPHQKDEHDIWICKDCGWRYPNSKPSAKVRKHHKKQCSGKSEGDDHDLGAGSSDDAASDDEHDLHHHRKRGDMSTQTAVSSVPNVDVTSPKNRSFDFSVSASDTDDQKLKSGSPHELHAGGEEQGMPKDPVIIDSQDKVEEAREDAVPSAIPVPASPINTGLMLHQKDEHDIWICKNCGWKYPNAKPSAKVRKHHKRQCAGKGEGHAGGASSGWSSDEYSDDEHEHHPGHHNHHRGSPTPGIESDAAGRSEGLSEASTMPPIREESKIPDFLESESTAAGADSNGTPAPSAGEADPGKFSESSEEVQVVERENGPRDREEAMEGGNKPPSIEPSGEVSPVEARENGPGDRPEAMEGDSNPLSAEPSREMVESENGLREKQKEAISMEGDSKPPSTEERHESVGSADQVLHSEEFTGSLNAWKAQSADPNSVSKSSKEILDIRQADVRPPPSSKRMAGRIPTLHQWSLGSKGILGLKMVSGKTTHGWSSDKRPGAKWRRI